MMMESESLEHSILVEENNSYSLSDDGVGILADDPFFDEFVVEMKNYRENFDAESYK